MIAKGRTFDIYKIVDGTASKHHIQRNFDGFPCFRPRQALFRHRNAKTRGDRMWSLLIGWKSSRYRGEKMKVAIGYSCMPLRPRNLPVAQQRTATNVPSVERLRAHIEYLASDKLAGRRTGTAGANLAAEYIAREFSRYGLRRSIGRDLPGMSILEADSPKRYLQEFPYVAGVELANTICFHNPAKADDIAHYRFCEDWMPLGFSSTGKHGAERSLPVGFIRELKYTTTQRDCKRSVR